MPGTRIEVRTPRAASSRFAVGGGRRHPRSTRSRPPPLPGQREWTPNFGGEAGRGPERVAGAVGALPREVVLLRTEVAVGPSWMGWGAEVEVRRRGRRRMGMLDGDSIRLRRMRSVPDHQDRQ